MKGINGSSMESCCITVFDHKPGIQRFYIRIVVFTCLVSIYFSYVTTLRAQETQTETDDENTAQIELPQYVIYGKDTRVYRITGDKHMFFRQYTMPYFLPIQARDVSASLGLLPEALRQKRTDDFSSTNGWHSFIRGEVGVFSHLLFHLKTGKYSNGRGIMVNLLHDSAQLNRANNTGATIEKATIRGYLDLKRSMWMNIAISALRDTDNDFSSFHQFRRRNVTGYESKWQIHSMNPQGNDLDITAEFFRTDYKGKKYDPSDVKEKLSRLNILKFFTLIRIPFQGQINYERDTVNGYTEELFHSSVTGNLQRGVFSARFGGRFYLKDFSGRDANSYGFGILGLGWSLTPQTSLSFHIKPGLNNRPFRSLFTENGLVSYRALPLPENHKRDEEITFSMNSLKDKKIIITLGNREIKNAVIWNPVYRSPVDSTRVTFEVRTFRLTDRKLNILYHTPLRKNIQADVTLELHRFAFKDTTAEVPLKPETIGNVTVTWDPHFNWRLECSICYEGSRYKNLDSNDQLDGFFVTNLRAVRTLGKIWSASIDVNNLFNRKYALWPDNYTMPKIRVFLGINGAW